MDALTFTTVESVSTVLHSPDFAPPQSPPSSPGMGDDEVSRLRSAMARFSHGTEHHPRRAAVASMIAGIDPAHLETDARRRTARRLTGGPVEAMAEIAFVVPTEVLAAALGVPEPALPATREAVLRVVEVIGRRQPVTVSANEAAALLRHRFDRSPDEGVAAISLLYQNHDATAALVAATILADHLARPRRSALAATTRVAICDTTADGRAIPEGTTVTLDLEAADLEFGAGPHECPGRTLAQALVSGIMVALAEARYELDADSMGLGADGRPRTLAMRRRST